MDYMFRDCESLEKLDISNFKINDTIPMDFLFNCRLLKVIVSKFNDDNIKNNFYRDYPTCYNINFI